MKQIKFLNKTNNKEELILTGKVGERVFPIVNNVKETNDAIRWCNTHNVGDVFDCNEYCMEIVKEL